MKKKGTTIHFSKKGGCLRRAFLTAAAAAFLTGATAFGAEFTTEDSVLTLETPDDDWKQVEDSSTWATLSDGTDRITLLHYSNGEQLPDMTVAGDGYAQVYQTALSTENEVFIITGSVADKKDFDEVREAVQSVKINQYDTKKAVKNVVDDSELAGMGAGSTAKGAGDTAKGAADSAQNSSGSGTGAASDAAKKIEPAQDTLWVSSQQLNVRSQSSTDAAVLGTLGFMDCVDVTGIETAGGKETGWYQISYNGSTGYVSSAYLTDVPATAETLGYTLTSEQVTLYSEDGNGATYVYKATNGNWYDGSGRQYQPNGGGSWTLLTTGSKWTENAPASPADTAVDQVQVTDEEGLNSGTLYQQADGTWENEAGGVYTDNGDGTWSGPDGALWSES